LDAASRAVIRRAGETYGISARGVVRTRRVARTIADLAGKSQVSAGHVMDALQFRMPIERR
jgi:magnesium chelatase family protein